MHLPKISKLIIKKFFLYTTTIVVVGLVVLYFGGRWYLSNAYKFEYFDYSFFSSIKKDIRQTPKLSSKFENLVNKIVEEKQTYNSHYKDYFCTNVLLYQTHRPTNIQGNYAKEVYNIFKKRYNRQNTWKLFVDESLVYAFGLEKEFGVDNLNNFYFNNCEYQISIDTNVSLNLYGITAIAKYKFHTSVDSLSTDQLIELYFLSGDKSRNDFLNDTIKYKERLKVIKTIYENNL